ncbi:MFS transporter [Pseudomonas mangrovi]|jgi:MFS family permease|uniref:MFS transporter n=1 Tax=Pseudomonas mangrovi TaxID=2161748 RepID=A0A2T5PCM8_9PSED|nr:MFS transporter [Pseudomonas mangrovi]PTU75481.1 MFS transporter [Pseudomonas mangrovi]
MWSHILPISSLLSGVALLLLGNGLLNTLLTLRGVHEGYSTTMLGLVMSGYFVGYLLGTWINTPLIRRVGHIRAFAFFAAVAASIALMHVLVVDPWFWLFLRVGYGMALIGLYMVIESWLNAQASNEQRGQIFAVYMVVNLVALAIAQQLLGLAAPTEFILFALAAILICCALTPIALTRQAQPNIPDTHAVDLRHLIRVAPLALFAAAISGLSMGGFWGMAPVYASLNGMDASGVGLLMSLSILGGALLQWPIGRFSDNHDRRTVLFWVVSLAVLVSLLLSMMPTGIWMLALFFVWGGLAFAVYPLAVAQLIDQLHPDEILSGSSGLLLVNGVGAICGPLLAGVLIEQLGPDTLPLFFAACFAALAIYNLHRLRHVSDLISDPPAHFVPMLRTSPTVLELVPEVPESIETQARAEAEEHY